MPPCGFGERWLAMENLEDPSVPTSKREAPILFRKGENKSYSRRHVFQNPLGAQGLEEKMMPAGGGEQGCRALDGDARSHSQPPFPALEMKKHAASLPTGFTEQDRGGRHEDAAPLPTTEEQHPLGSLPADVLFGILPRVPYRSLCRFKCVSKPWLALCSDPDIRKKSSQTLSGFFYNASGHVKFRNLSGRGPPLVDPSLPFLSGSYDRFEVRHCCGGLLLCTCWGPCRERDEYDFVVCNPMTGQWTVLPPIMVQSREEEGDLVCFKPIDIFLGFDVAVSSRFTVFASLTNDHDCHMTEMAIYSSKTRRWTTVECEDETVLAGDSECVFLNGTMHLAAHYSSLLTVDPKGEDWGIIEIPQHLPVTSGTRSKVSIGQSQGRLHVWQVYREEYGHDDELYVWVLEDYGSTKWTLKHTVTVSKLFGRRRGRGYFYYRAFAIHPDANCIFITDDQKMAVAYDMDNRKVKVSSLFEEFKDVLPYTPCFAEWS